MHDITRPIIGIENRTPQEVFDIMCGRIRALHAAPAPEAGLVVVPREPTEEMLYAAMTAARLSEPPFLPACKELWASGKVWTVMLAASENRHDG